MTAPLTQTLLQPTAEATPANLFAPPAAAPAAQAPAPAWYETLPEAYRQDASITKHQSHEQMLAEYVNLSANGGQTQLPDFSVPFEQNKELFMKLGVPEAADKYDLGLPEGFQSNPEFLSKIQEVAHQYKIPNEALKALAAVDVEFVNAMTAQQNQTAEQVSQASHETLSNLWGRDSEIRSAYTQKAFNQFSSLDEAEQLGAAQVLENPYFLHVMSKIGEAMQVPVSPGASSASGAAVQNDIVHTPDQAIAALQAVWDNPEKAKVLGNPKHPDFKKTNGEVDRLYSIAYPNGMTR